VRVIVYYLVGREGNNEAGVNWQHEGEIFMGKVCEYRGAIITGSVVT